MINKHKTILDFIKKHTLCVISTITPPHQPEAAVVEYGENNEFELIFDTFTDARKSKNLRLNNKIAVVIGWDDNITLQYEGEAFELKYGVELNKYKHAYFQKNPRAKKWENREGITYFKIVPRWIHYSDLNVYPWNVFEITF